MAIVFFLLTSCIVACSVKTEFDLFGCHILKHGFLSMLLVCEEDFFSCRCVLPYDFKGIPHKNLIFKQISGRRNCKL